MGKVVHAVYVSPVVAQSKEQAKKGGTPKNEPRRVWDQSPGLKLCVK